MHGIEFTDICAIRIIIANIIHLSEQIGVANLPKRRGNSEIRIIETIIGQQQRAITIAEKILSVAQSKIKKSTGLIFYMPFD